LKRLLDRKDEAHYGLMDVSGADLRASLRQARSVIDFAARILAQP
jgi:hypothetical protein